MDAGAIFGVLVVAVVIAMVVVSLRREQTGTVTELDAYRRCHPHGGRHPWE